MNDYQILKANFPGRTINSIDISLSPGCIEWFIFTWDRKYSYSYVFHVKGMQNLSN